MALGPGRAVVLSPHLDDGIFSLGAAISSTVRGGGHVDVVTVFAGDPGSVRPAGPWDRAAGFRTEGEAVRARRREDRAACNALGASAIWLPFSDEQYGGEAGDDAVWDALSPHLEEADAILVPGFPLDHRDHLRTAALVTTRMMGNGRLGLYAEQPYATWRGAPIQSPSTPAVAAVVAGEPVWQPVATTSWDRRRKWRACLAYRSQMRRILLRTPALPWRVARYERRMGGEAVAWVSSRKVHR
jgi:LmbE family N-acetylglucosaminyl deacetylase